MDWSDKAQVSAYNRAQHKAKYAERRDHKIRLMRKWSRDNAEKRRATSKQTHRTARQEAIAVYGCECVKCGEKRWQALTFDHINNDGAKHRRTTGGGGCFVYWLRRNQYPQGIVQLLCWTCNALKQYHPEMFHAIG